MAASSPADVNEEEGISAKKDGTTESPPVAQQPYSAFSAARKKFILSLVVAKAFIAPVSGSIYMPLLPVLTEDLKVSPTLINLTVTVFMLTFAVAPLLFASLSDARGRKPVYVLGLLIGIGANIALASAPAHYASFMILRVVQAFGGSALYSLGAGTVVDIFEPKQRGRAISYYSLGPQLGPILGPVIGGMIAQRSTWRWTFGFLAIFGSVCLLVSLFLLPETLRSRVGNGSIHDGKSWLQWPSFNKRAELTPREIATQRPSRRNIPIFMRHPIIMLSCINVSILFGSYYCLSVTFPSVLQERYGFNNAEIGLAFLAPGLGMTCGSVICGHLSDWARQRHLEKTKADEAAPEQRLHIQIIGTALFPIGVLLYGWLGNFGIGVAGGFAFSWTLSTNNTYVTLVAPGQAATLVALTSLLRNPAAAIGAALIDPLISAEGFGWCFTGLAIVDLSSTGIALLSLAKGSSWREAFEKTHGKSMRP
ncbi:dityrosine transporter A [Histoplasma capsulatum]|uniref:Citrate exporter 1 n=1 Tax=Ajellomyces capsulatus TaxID=5037 RepID=A0A8A1LYT7_AJECA|nr:dityrosine transporter A [Histoplasma capsulatum]